MANRIWKLNNLKKTMDYLRKNGVRHAYYAALERVALERAADYYYRAPEAQVLAEQRRETKDYPYLFSIVVPAYETKEEFLREMIDSVRAQSYSRWELIIVDASGSDVVEKCVKRILESKDDARIKYRRLAENKGISGNTNEGIALAAGDYIALLDHDDLLAPDALYYMAAAVHDGRQQAGVPALLYTDEDKYDDSGRYFTTPHIKEKFNLDLILSNNYICHFMAVEAELMKSLKLRAAFDGAQDYDLVLRVVGKLLESIPACRLKERIVHIPRVLYHWRCHADSTAENTASKCYAYDAGREALLAFCAGQHWQVNVEHGLHLGFYEIAYTPDLLAVRQEVGLVGGRLLDGRGRICGGAMAADGTCMFEGLHKEYSGGLTHRAVLKQETPAVDIRCVQVRRELQEEFAHITGIPYRERTIRCRTGQSGRGAVCNIQIADVSGLSCDEAGYRKLSLELSGAAADRGYLVVWNPQITCRTHR